MASTVIHARSEEGLRNGSFYRQQVRRRGTGPISHYINGDFMGWVQTVPPDLKSWPWKEAKKLLPKGI